MSTVGWGFFAMYGGAFILIVFSMYAVYRWDGLKEDREKMEWDRDCWKVNAVSRQNRCSSIQTRLDIYIKKEKEMAKKKEKRAKKSKVAKKKKVARKTRKKTRKTAAKKTV